jgi:hypothetical protein
LVIGYVFFFSQGRAHAYILDVKLWYATPFSLMKHPSRNLSYLVIGIFWRGGWGESSCFCIQAARIRDVILWSADSLLMDEKSKKKPLPKAKRSKQGITNTPALPIDKMMLYIYLLCSHSAWRPKKIGSNLKQSKHIHQKNRFTQYETGSK